MADTKLSALTELAAAPAAGDELYVRDVSEAAADESKRITFTNAQKLVANLTLNGFNIAFPATQVADGGANILDDYEEGTWTPTLQFGGAAVSMTGTFTGVYTKIGRMVIARTTITLTAKGSSSGAAVASLPFAAGALGTATLQIKTITYAESPYAEINNAAATVNINEVTEAGTASNLTEGNFANTSQVIIVASYEV